MTRETLQRFLRSPRFIFMSLVKLTFAVRVLMFSVMSSGIGGLLRSLLARSKLLRSLVAGRL